MGKARVLCVDHDLPTVSIISGVLRKEGYDVDAALDGHDGLKKARETKPDLIILADMMPDLDGYEVCNRLTDNPETANISIIMLTAKRSETEPTKEGWIFAGKVKNRIKRFDCGALEFLTKPVKARELTLRVKAALWASGVPV